MALRNTEGALSTGDVNPLLGGSGSRMSLWSTYTEGRAGSCGEPTSGNGSRTSTSNSARRRGAVEYLQSFAGVPGADRLDETAFAWSLFSSSSGLVGSLESIEPAGEAAKRASSRKEAFAFWKSLCICATWPGLAADLVRGDANLFRPMFEAGNVISECCWLSLLFDELAPGVFGESSCGKTLEKKREERLRGGSNGAAGIRILVCSLPGDPNRGRTVWTRRTLGSSRWSAGSRRLVR